MALHANTRSFMAYLNQNSGVRDRIAAPPDKTLLYSGSFVRPMWRELETLRQRYHSDGFVLLPDALKQLPSPDKSAATLQLYVTALTGRVPWDPDGFVIWRALSGIFAANAKGRVYFAVGSGVDGTKVFPLTELSVLERNQNIDALTREVVFYLRGCVLSGKTDINFGLVPST